MDKWSWKMDWCKKNGVGSGSFGMWNLAEKAWNVLNALQAINEVETTLRIN